MIKVLLALVISIASLSAQQRFVYPAIHVAYGSSFTYFTLDSPQKLYITYVPGDIGLYKGTIGAIGEVASPGELSMCLYDVDLNGYTVGDPIACKTFYIDSSLRYKWFYYELDSAVQLSSSKHYGVVFKLGQYTSQSISIGESTNASAGNVACVGCLSRIYNGSSWYSRGTTPYLHVSADGNTYARSVGLSLRLGALNITSTPNEIGMKCKWPYDVIVWGVAQQRDFYYQGNSGAAEFRLYQDVTMLRSATSNAGGQWTVRETAIHYWHVHFQRPYYVPAGTEVIASFKPTTTTYASAIRSQLNLPPGYNSLGNAYIGISGAQCVPVTRKDNAPWSENPNYDTGTAFIIEVVK